MRKGVRLSLFLATMSSPSAKRKSPYFATEPATPPSKKTTTTPRTKDSPDRKGSLPPLVHSRVPPHTLFLGTQPSDNSLKHSGYYLTNANAFWWIVGDALGFRRDFHLDGRTEAVDFIRPHLFHEDTATYDDAVERLTARGYAVWDVVCASDRKGSLDSDIRNATFNDVPAFLDRHPSIAKICFSTGAESARRFRRAHRTWLSRTCRFRAADDAASRSVFGDLLPSSRDGSDDVVELCVMESVSPAANPRQTWSAAKQRAKGFTDAWALKPAAIYPYKRAHWFRLAFSHEPAVLAAPPFGESPSHFRPDEP